ncbi:hypothetical protein HGH92_33005 [Chitinophaga varians]|uniref:Uncharacterized protein n=1 Tax=Chitinophaga varians TaxID=2202339 RepID=A0A847S3Y0_9BACT|nr:hypothetical protein [Chitinophaga varians]NLR69164.1 hypothetical protein [Chitinophaga varians]
MSVNNIKVYDILRKDLHLGDKKAQELISEMDAIYGKELLKTDVKELSTKLDKVDTKMDEVKKDLVSYQTKLGSLQTQMQTDFKEICSKIGNTGLIQYVTITGTILGIIWTYIKFFK